MGDVSAEPSMEDILSSIKRIIAEEGDPAPARPRRQARAAPRAVEADDRIADGDDEEADEILELNDPMPTPVRQATRAVDPAPASPMPLPSASQSAMPPPSAPQASAPQPSPPASPARAAAPPPAEPIVSQQAAAATRGSLDALSRMMVKPDPASDGTLEGLVRDMLRPMLREWLDANLPGMVESMVTREIAKITGRPE